MCLDEREAKRATFYKFFKCRRIISLSLGKDSFVYNLSIIYLIITVLKEVSPSLAKGSFIRGSTRQPYKTVTKRTISHRFLTEPKNPRIANAEHWSILPGGPFSPVFSCVHHFVCADVSSSFVTERISALAKREIDDKP